MSDLKVSLFELQLNSFFWSRRAHLGFVSNLQAWPSAGSVQIFHISLQKIGFQPCARAG
jgi:hypothetical protein